MWHGRYVDCLPCPFAASPSQSLVTGIFPDLMVEPALVYWESGWVTTSEPHICLPIMIEKSQNANVANKTCKYLDCIIASLENTIQSHVLCWVRVKSYGSQHSGALAVSNANTAFSWAYALLSLDGSLWICAWSRFRKTHVKSARLGRASGYDSPIIVLYK